MSVIALRPAETQDVAAPYLSVVVASRNDGHGGDPLARLQAFVNTFAEQCRRTRLPAEIIVVEWNPPADRPRVAELLAMPRDAPFAVHFVEVPPEIHRTLRSADVLPLFQMIAKNVGVRRARGRFILATNIDIIFSTELVEHLASGQLEPGRIYRADRHDIEAAFPAGARLEDQMAYCQTHQIRVHTSSGTHAVDRCGRPKPLELDVIGSIGFTLGDGWYAREGDATDGFFRWVTPEARVAIDRTAWPTIVRGSVLDVELETNPYQPNSWVDLEILDGKRPLARRRVSGRRRVRLDLDDGVARHEIVMRGLDSSGGRQCLPLLESRWPLCYRVRNVSLRTIPSHEYVLRRLFGSAPLEAMNRKDLRARLAWIARAAGARIEFLVKPFRRPKTAASSVRLRRSRRFHQTIVEDSERVRKLEARLAALAPLADLAPLARLLREHRPTEIHQNACGDFQLMAREHWFALRGYPEFEMFSMSIDGAFEAIARAAGIREHVFEMPLCIYHLEHEKGSGWSPEGEALLTKRIAESDIPWLDAGAVHIWMTYMQWLRRPMIFNGPDWGFGDVVLPKKALQPAANTV